MTLEIPVICISWMHFITAPEHKHKYLQVQQLYQRAYPLSSFNPCQPQGYPVFSSSTNTSSTHFKVPLENTVLQLLIMSQQWVFQALVAISKGFVPDNVQKLLLFSFSKLLIPILSFNNEFHQLIV